MLNVPTLSAPVGGNLPNNPADMRVLREYLNKFIMAGYLGPLLPLPSEGTWDVNVVSAMQVLEDRYFYGKADPDNKLETNDTLFQFLVSVDNVSSGIGAQLSAETYQLAALMVPGGADWTKRTTVISTEIVNGKSVKKKQIKPERIQGNIRTYLPDLLRALRNEQLGDTNMLMMALGSIRAEASGFKPIDEGVSKYNTTPKGTKGRHLYDKYDHRSDLGNDAYGDGALWKGRGYIQLTGHANYTDIGSRIGVDLVTDPDVANDPIIAARVLASFLKRHETGIRAALSVNNLTRARKLVNGGSHGLAEFKESFAAGRSYLHIIVPQAAKRKVVKKAKKAK